MMLIIAALLMELAKTKSVLNLMNNVDLSKKSGSLQNTIIF